MAWAVGPIESVRITREPGLETACDLAETPRTADGHDTRSSPADRTRHPVALHASRSHEKIGVRLTKDQIKDSPEFNPGEDHRSDAYRERVGAYYNPYL